MSLAGLDSVIRSVVLPRGRALGVSPKALPVLLFLNVAMALPGSGAAAGYHSAVGGQTYGAASFDSSQSGYSLGDVSILSHELAEWADDPFVNNATPPWGHTGQVSGCSPLLEVGDPLTFTLLGTVKGADGFTYHLQETAFFSWFFGEVPSLGIAGWYSSGNTLKAPASLCH
jgi:hypothetical protein